eukprot:2363057-Lingulodinium_polyedra.AAC.1
MAARSSGRVGPAFFTEHMDVDIRPRLRDGSRGDRYGVGEDRVRASQVLFPLVPACPGGLLAGRSARHQHQGLLRRVPEHSAK